MGDTKLYLLLLLITHALAQQGNDGGEETTSTCLLGTRLKNFKKYVYQYEAESKNGVSGTANLKSGPKIACKVEVEVQQTCGFLLRTSECSLSEVSVINPQGQPVYRPAAGSDTFLAAMEKNPLKFVVEENTQVNLYPEQDEPTNILNIKRGIVSALLVPVVEEESNSYMATLHGMCKTDFTVNARKDIATDVTISRDLSECDHFSPMKDYTSPLALVSGMHVPLSKLIRSTQTCSYQFDNKRKHMTAATCAERHIFLPFSHDKTYGISSEVLQTLTLVDSSKINSRILEYDEANLKPLFMEYAEDKAPIQSKDSMLATLGDLSGLSKTEQGQQRASLFQKLITEVRSLKNETLGPAVAEMMEVSSALTWQALAQCGTPECTSAILQILRTFDSSTAPGADAAVYALGLLPNPCNRRVRDMLSMAQHKPSKPIMYGLSNSVKKFYQTHGKVTPEITEVSEFMASQLGDCTGDEDQTYLTLRVIGNMGKAMEAAGPSLKSTLLKCVRQNSASLSVQQAAIQAFRQMTIDREVSGVLLQTYQDSERPVQRRLAAYLMLMRSPETADLIQVMSTLMGERDEQVKSFVASHITNILNYKDDKTQELRQRILEALEDNEVPTSMDFYKSSRNYMLNPMMSSVEGNVIFDSTGKMPREVMLETTLNAFGYNLDMLEFGMEGEGFEPTLDALFGENGFFPDTASKAMYWAQDKMSPKVQDILQNWIAPLKNERMKRQVPRDIVREIGNNFSKLMKELSTQNSPEAKAYLRILGTELGYIKSGDMHKMTQIVSPYVELLLKTLPAEFMKSLLSSTDNELFAHYIFMDNEFSLPTSSGFPLKFSMSGVFAPGAKGGLSMTPGMREFSFMPTVGVEFVTHMGIYIPEFILAGVKMHTNMYHESALKAKVTMDKNQIKFSVPAPQGTTQLFSISNRLLSVSSTQTKILPSMVEDRTDSVECNGLFFGVKYCTIIRYSNASSTDAAPHYPLTGETRLAVEIQPTGEVTDYTATFAYELVKEGKEGRQKADVVKMVLKAEGAQPSEATVAVKYNRNKNLLSGDIQIPDYDVEAGIRLSASDSTMKGKKMRTVTLDVTNKNIPQLTLVSRARLEGMKDGMLQFQLTIPALQTDATATALLKSADGLTLQLESSIKVPETSSLQRITFRYDDNKVEVEVKSDLSSEIQKLMPDTERYQRHLQKLVDDILDQRVAKTDMKLRHIVSKSIEASNIWLDKIAADIPYVENLRNKRHLPEFTLPALPEKLYLKYDSLLRYQFNKDSITITLPLPWGGKTSRDLNIPATLTIPHMRLDLIETGLYIPSTEVRVPSFTIPESYDLNLPLLGVAEVSAKVNSNFYNWEGSIAGGNITVDIPHYTASYKMVSEGPIDIFSYKTEGLGMIRGNTETTKYSINGSIGHSLIDASFSLMESFNVEENPKFYANYKFEVSSPVGLQASCFYSSHATFSGPEITGGANVDGKFRLGSIYANSNYIQSYTINEDANGESTLKVDSTLFQVLNKIKGGYNSGVLSIQSNTKINNDALEHVAKLEYKDAQLSLKSEATSPVFGFKLRNKAEFTISAEAASIRVETIADEAINRVYSLVSGSLNARGMEINSDGSIAVDVSRGSHKATLKINTDGLLTSSTTTLQSNPLTFENIINGGIDRAGATLSLISKGSIHQNSADLKIDGKIAAEEAFLNTVYKGNLFDANSMNRMNLKVNKQGLTFSNNLMGSLQKMKTEHTQSVSLTLWTLTVHSKTDNYICDSTSYKHDIRVDMKPFLVSVNVNNDLKLLDADFTNDGKLKLEPYSLSLTGSLKGAYGEEKKFRHTYEIGYIDLTGTLKCSTTGNILGALMSQNSDLEIAGLSSKFNGEAQFKSKSLRLDSRIRTLAMPFSFSVDAFLIGDGEMNMYGKHTGQLNSKFLMKAEPLNVAYSHDCKASTSHVLDGGKSADTHFDNKVDGQLNTEIQSATWRMKSKFNNHAYYQNISVYNNAEIAGAELSGTMLSDLLNKPLSVDCTSQEKELTISGFLKYDKNRHFHVVELPFIKSFPAIFDTFRKTMLSVLESLQHYINSADINELVGEFRANLDKLPQKINDFVRETDLENKVNEAKDKLIALTQEHIITMEDLEASMDKLKAALEKALIELVTKFQDLVTRIREQIENGTWSNIITDGFMVIGNGLKDFNERHELTKTIISAISAFEDIISKLDLQNLKDDSIAWLRELDAKYGIKDRFQANLSEMKRVIENFDIIAFIQDLKNYITSINVSEYLHKLKVQIPTEEITRVVDSIQDVISNWIEEYEIVEKINFVYSQIRELILKYELEKKIRGVMDQIVELIKQYKIQKTVQSMVDTLKSIDFQSMSDKVMQQLDDAIDHLKGIDAKQIIVELNNYIALITQKMAGFDYNAFVDEANQKINEMITYINKQIQSYEIPQKIEASREFVRGIQATLHKYLEQLKNTKVAELLRMLKDVIDTTAFNDIKLKLQENLEDIKQRINKMDIRQEILLQLERASRFYTNLMGFITNQINVLMEKVQSATEHSEIIQKVLEFLNQGKFEIQSFTVPLTDLVVPIIQINMNELHKTRIPEQITIPEFTVMGTYTITSITIDFKEIKQRIIEFINSIRNFEMPLPDPEVLFGDLRLAYLPNLPDLTLSEITLSEIRFPEIRIPKLNLENFEITMLPIPKINLPPIPSEIQVPAFGKLYGEFRINSPYYKLKTEAALQNSTSNAKTPQFTASLTSQAESCIKHLAYSLDATARLAANRMKSLSLTETFKFNHEVFEINHEGGVTLSSTSPKVTAKTMAKVKNEYYAADIVNNVVVVLEGGISASMDTTYNHNLNIPTPEISSQVNIIQKSSARLETGTISVTIGTTGSGKWEILGYSDGGTHKSDFGFNVNLNTAKLTFSGETSSEYLKMKQTANAESVIFSHMNLIFRAETETPYIKSSVLMVNGKAQIEDLKIEFSASHDTELIGKVSGKLSNSVDFLAQPFEVVFNCKNQGMSKIILPIKITGKIDYQNDYGVTLKSGMQRASWVGLARFNQYRYSHSFEVNNNEKEIGIHTTMNGEANLDFLTVPISIPEINVPYSAMKTPKVTEFSLWEDTGLKNLLTTTRQSFEMNFKLQYQKNPDMHAIDFDLEPVYMVIKESTEMLNEKFESGRDVFVDFLTYSYDQAKAKYEKYKIDTSNRLPRTIMIPGYTVPFLNIEVSPFIAELPGFSFILPMEVSTPSFKVPVVGFTIPTYTLVLPSLELPVMHVPTTLSQLSLPKFTLPAMQNNILVPAMGNVTYDFSFKSPVITMSVSAGLYNQSDIVARLEASSTSVFDVLKSKIDGTTSLTRKRGLKLATALSLEHMNIQGNHDSTVSLTKKNLEASVITIIKANLPILNLEFNQELRGNTKTKPNVASKMKVKYSFNLPTIDAVGKGNIDHDLTLEGLTSYISLETSTEGKIDGTVMVNGNFAGTLKNQANVYLNANGLRSTVNTDASSKANYKKTDFWNMEMKENLALEASLRRLYAMLIYTNNNEANIASFNTKGKQLAKATIEFVPLTTLFAGLEIDVSQPSSIGEAIMLQKINLALTAEKQKLSWSGKEQLASAVHACDLLLSNDETEIRMEVGGSVEGHVPLLKSIRLPIYQKTLWNVLKFDLVTSEDRLQFLNASSVVVYTKNKEGFYFALPTKVFENGITFSIPEMTLTVPAWVRNLPQNIREIDMRFESITLPEQLSIPPVVTIPSFQVPYTTLEIPSYSVDLKNIEIPKFMSTPSFEVNLPHLPKVKIPSINIDTEYLRDKMSSLYVKLPQYEITISSFTLPKTFTIGEHTLNLDDIAKQISNFEMPSITIPEQKIEVPEISLHLPAGVLIPYFGALSTTVKISSPIYNVSWSAMLENKSPFFVSSLKSSCSSTMVFLEYDLDATAITRFENGLLSLDGNGTLIHSDLKLVWLQTLTQNLRMKRQASIDTSASRHTLNIDITSPTFADMNLRYASRKDSISASVSSPSSGFLGLLLQRKTPSQVYGRVFSRYSSAPDKDVEILSAKATLKNSEKLNLQTAWNLQAPIDMFDGLKERLPAITSALFKFTNKYHTAHFGIDINRASLKLKNAISNTIERAYQDVLRCLDMLQNGVEEIKDHGKALYKRASDNMPVMDLQELSNKLSDNIRLLLSKYQKNIKVLLDAVIKFLSETKFQLPGFKEKLTGQVLFQRASRYVGMVIDKAVQAIDDFVEVYTDILITHISNTEFTIPGTDRVVNGREVLEKLKSSMKDIQSKILEMVRNLESVKLQEILERLRNFLQQCIQNAEELLTSLKALNLDDLTTRIINTVDGPTMRGISVQVEKAKKTSAQYKDAMKVKIQDTYAQMTMDRLNTDVQSLIDVAKSHTKDFLDKLIQLLQESSKSAQPYIRVSNKKMDIDIPLPFLWKSFSELPTSH